MKTIAKISIIVFLIESFSTMFINADLNLWNIYLTSTNSDRFFFLFMWLAITGFSYCFHKMNVK